MTWFSFIICMSWSSSGLLQEGQTEGLLASRPGPSHLSSLGLVWGIPDGVFLLVTEVSVPGKEDGVVGHGRLTCG